MPGRVDKTAGRVDRGWRAWQMQTFLKLLREDKITARANIQDLLSCFEPTDETDFDKLIKANPFDKEGRKGWESRWKTKKSLQLQLQHIRAWARELALPADEAEHLAHSLDEDELVSQDGTVPADQDEPGSDQDPFPPSELSDTQQDDNPTPGRDQTEEGPESKREMQHYIRYLQWERRRKREKLQEMETRGELPDDVVDRLRVIRLRKGARGSDRAGLNHGGEGDNGSKHDEDISAADILRGFAQAATSARVELE
ncbi:hypothetical protein QBC39DRAFT_14982 [Podospora conica]|nr:hypothetical protein QBC39DRAFT_14982 [Schizothecium conicum]